MSKKNQRKKKNNLARNLIVVGVMALAAALMLIKAGNKPLEAPAESSGTQPAVQLQNALNEHRPTLAFFHSYNCQQCIEMMEIVQQVHPEFTGSIVLVDIDVYDERNESLLRQVGLQYIPTLFFYDITGQSEISIGVMEADLLRQKLSALAEGN